MDHALPKQRKTLREVLSSFGNKLGHHTTSTEQLKVKYADEKSQYVEVDGTLIHYQDEGQGPILLLIHGVMASLHTWDGWVDKLKSKYRIIRFDIPGFGLSPAVPNQKYNPEYTVNMLNGFVDALGIDRYCLIGNSLGGFISWNFAATHPEKIDKLVLIDPIAYEQPLPPLIRFVTLPGVRRIARKIAPRLFVDTGVRNVYGQPDKIQPATFQRYYDLLSHPGARGAMVDVFLTFKYFNGHPDVTSKMKTIKVPTLLMWGEADAWVPVSLLDNWRRDVPHAQVITYPGAGHIPMEELPEQTAMDADSFLSHKEDDVLKEAN